MGTISARIPDELEEIFESYVEEEGLERSTAIRKLLAEGLDDWRRERALARLAEGEISFTRAAEQAQLSVWEFATLVKRHKINWVDEEYTLEDLASL